jgi:hypothetical protein
MQRNNSRVGRDHPHQRVAGAIAPDELLVNCTRESPSWMNDMIAPTHVTLLAIGLLAVPAAALPQYAESKWTVDEDGATCARYRYWLWSEEVVEEYRIQGLQREGFIFGADEAGFLELVQLDPVFGMANLVLTGGFSGLHQMDALTWFRRHGLDLSVTGMHEW